MSTQLEARFDRGAAEAFTFATTAIKTSSSIALQHGVLITAADGHLTFRSMSPGERTEMTVPANIKSEGQVLLPARRLADYANKLPDASVLLKEQKNGTVALRCRKVRGTINVMEADGASLAPFHLQTGDTDEVLIKADSFVRLFGAVSHAASSDTARPVLTAVRITVEKGVLRLAATDSYRLCTAHEEVDSDVEIDVLVPTDPLSDAIKMAKEAGGGVLLRVITTESGSKIVEFRLGDRALQTHLVEGSYPEVLKLIPDSFESVATVDRDAITSAVQRAVALVKGTGNNKPVALHFKDGKVSVKATGDAGSHSESLECEYEGKLTIQFNPTFLVAALNQFLTEQIEVHLNGGLSPAVITSQGAGTDPRLLTLLMPMRAESSSDEKDTTEVDETEAASE